MDPYPSIRARGRARGQPRAPPPNQFGQSHEARPPQAPPLRPQARNMPGTSGPRQEFRSQSVRNIFLKSK